MSHSMSDFNHEIKFIPASLLFNSSESLLTDVTYLVFDTILTALLKTLDNWFLFIWGFTSLSTLYRAYHDG